MHAAIFKGNWLAIINEERKRHLINNILVQSELRRRAINRSTDKLMFNKYNTIMTIV